MSRPGGMNIGRLLIGLILVVFGLGVLLANLGWIEWSFVLSLLNLWPVVLIVIGLYLWFGRTRPTLTIALAVVLVLGSVGLAWAERDSDRGFFRGPGSVSTTEITGPPAHRFESGHLSVDGGALRIVVRGEKSGRATLGEFRSRFDPVISSFTHGDTYELKIGQKAGARVSLPFGWGEGNEHLEVALDPDIAWGIEADVGAADVDLNLTDVLLERLAIDAGASSIDITVGSRVVEGAQIELDGGAASFALSIPSDLNVTVETESGLSSDTFDPEFRQADENTYVHEGPGNTLTVSIRSGVSSTDVTLD